MSRIATATLLTRARSVFRWDPEAQRFRSAGSGKFVSAAEVKRAAVRVANGAKREIAELAGQVADGTIDVGEWQVRTAATIKSLHLAQTAAARGGFANLTPADYGRVGQSLRFHYERLNAFALDVEAGRLTVERIVARAGLYAAAGNGTYEAARRAGAESVGMLFEKNVLGDGEHCDQCIQQSMRGWVDIGSLVPVGRRTCRMNCLCRLEFRRDNPS